MRKSVVLILGVALLSASAGAWTAQQVQPASVKLTPPIEDVLVAVRSDLQGERADIMAKNITLSSAEAAKFWPLFEAYQKEQNVLMDDQLQWIQRYIENFETLDDAGALALINAHLERDTKMTVLRRKWLGEFQKALSTKQAVRVMQIDRRLSLTHQLAFASKIPLAY